MGLFLRKNNLLRCWGSVSSNLDWGSYIISIAKTTFKKIGAFIGSKMFLSPEVALYLYKSTTIHRILLSCLAGVKITLGYRHDQTYLPLD